MDAVFIERVRFRGKHGVSDEERQSEQEFLIDIVASIDLRQAAASDQLSDTADYRRFRDIAREVIEGPSVQLIERLAGLIAERVLKETNVESVTVTVKKTSRLPNGTPGVSVERTRI